MAAATALFAYMPVHGQDTAPAAPLSAWLDAMARSAVALATGDPSGAEVAARQALVARPRGEAAARADLALGLALREARRPGEAVPPLARALGRIGDPTLTAAVQLELAEALFHSGHAGEATPLFAQVAASAPPSMADRAAWRQADSLLRSGAFPEAVSVYRRLLALHPADPAAPEARFSLGEALRGSGDVAGAIATWRALWVERPEDPAGLAADGALRAWRRAGGAVPLPSDDDRMARAERFVELAMPGRALQTLRPVHPPAADAAARAALLRALALLRLGRRDEAVAIAGPLASDRAADDGIRAGATLVIARAASRAGKFEEAAARYRALSLSPPRLLVPGLTPAQSRALPEDAAYLAAWLFYDGGAYARAAELLRTYAREHPRSPHTLDARWFEAWSLVRSGRRADGQRALKKLARGRLEAQALYWLARLSTHRALARPLYRRVLRAAPPGSWYALLASARLSARPGRPPAYPAATGAAAPVSPLGTEAATRLAAAAQLAGAGLVADALAELHLLADSRDAGALAAHLAELAEALGDAELPFRMARDHLPPTARALRWLYPLAFPSLLDAAARDANLDPLLYRAVMRRESAFRTDARSPAGALGLVQLIPPTAERLASLHGVAASRARQLTSPEVSIPLGAAYLSLLADRFVDPSVVIAAYNAGPIAVAGWARDRAGMPLDEWVEDIPFRETRRYVKAVAADWAVYRALRGHAPLSIDGRRRVHRARQGVAF
jgi:soluble lytic murein transglycosylase